MKFSSANGAWGRRILTKIFGKAKRSDTECWDLQGFLRNTARGSGCDVKRYEDFTFGFIVEFSLQRVVPEIWCQWYENTSSEEDKWVVFEKKAGETRWAWVQYSFFRISDWATLDEDSPIKYETFKNDKGWWDKREIQ